MFVHGGGWYTGDKRSSVYAKADWLTGQGVLFVSVNYRLSPAPTSAPDRITFPTHPTDVGHALAFVRAQAAAWGGDPSRIALMGHSAGAHLASLVGTDPAYGAAPACVVSLDTHGYDIPVYLASGTGAYQTTLYHNAFTDDAAVQAAASPITYVGEAPSTAFLLVRQDVPGRAATTARSVPSATPAATARSTCAPCRPGSTSS